LIQLSLEQHRLDDAKAQLVELQKTHPKNPQTHLLDAMVAYASKEYGRTGTITDELLRLAPDDPQLLVLGGAANLRQGALIAAEAKLGKVVQTVERMTAARKMLAETYLQMGQAEKSLATLRPLLEQAKPDGDALAQAGQAYLQLGNPQQAEVAFSAAVKAKPEDFQVRTALALTEFLKGNSEAALASLQQIAAKDPGETADLALVSAHMRRRDFDAALKAIDSLERKAPTKATALHMRGLALLGKGDRKAARGSFEAALKVEPLHFASVASLASLDLQEKDPEAAVKRLTAAVKLDPKNTMARMVLLDVRTRQQATPSDLLVIIDDAIKAAPNDSAPRVARISFFAKANDTKAATSAAQDALAVLPLNPDVLDAAGRAFSAAGDDQQAVSAFNKLAGTMQRGALPYLRLADLHSKRGDSSAVVSSLNRALEAAPDSAEVHRRFLGHAVKNRDFKPVLSAAKELQKKLPHSAVGFLLEGDAEAARKSWQAATQAYRAALKLGGADGRPQKALYAALLASGDKEAAEKFAGDWLKSAPRDVGFRENLGDRAIARKDYVSAERLFREVLALQPGHPCRPQ
jgi:putative PEP-CTERM system TPR-repeat lipoprotein